MIFDVIVRRIIAETTSFTVKADSHEDAKRKAQVIEARWETDGHAAELEQATWSDDFDLKDGPRFVGIGLGANDEGVDEMAYGPDPEPMLTAYEMEVIAAIRHRGFAVIVWTPEEVKDANPRKVEDRSIELGWDVIKDLQ